MKNIYLIILFVFLSYVSNSQIDTDYVYVEGGKFVMGKNKQKDEPKHKVKINDFYILNHEVSNSEYAKFLNEKGNQHQGNTIYIELHSRWEDEKCRIYQQADSFHVENGYEDYPVVFVSWWGAEAYCEWAGGRLPSEAEYEYLAQKLWKNTNITQHNLSDYAVFKNNSNNIYSKVKSKQPTEGIYDLFGNLSEWCYDWYNANYYHEKEKNNPINTKTGNQKVKRGGSWVSKSASIYPSNRRASNPNNHSITIGFRVVKHK